jgi:hypothetical protein
MNSVGKQQCGPHITPFDVSFSADLPALSLSGGSSMSCNGTSDAGEDEVTPTLKGMMARKEKEKEGKSVKEGALVHKSRFENEKKDVEQDPANGFYDIFDEGEKGKLFTNQRYLMRFFDFSFNYIGALPDVRDAVHYLRLQSKREERHRNEIVRKEMEEKQKEEQKDVQESPRKLKVAKEGEEMATEDGKEGPFEVGVEESVNERPV